MSSALAGSFKFRILKEITTFIQPFNKTTTTMGGLSFVAAGLAFWFLGAIWYNVLGKAWQNELGFTDEYLQKGNMALKMVLSLVCMIAMCFAIKASLSGHFAAEGQTFGHGAAHGAAIGVFYAAMSMGINYIYQQRSIKLWLIDAPYQIIGLTVAGGIIAAWPW